jgi:hypothetical protein
VTILGQILTSAGSAPEATGPRPPSRTLAEAQARYALALEAANRKNTIGVLLGFLGGITLRG